MKVSWPVLLGVTVVAGVVLGAVGYNNFFIERHYRNLRVVDPGVLYRSGQLDEIGLERVAHELNIKTVVSFRDVRDDKAPDPNLEREEEHCKALGIAYLRLSPEPWGPDETGRIPVADNVREYVRFIDERRKAGAILIHCMRGVHRTGAYTAIYRMEFNDWDNHEAITEMVERGYDTLDEDPDIRHYIETYVPQLPSLRPGPVKVGSPASD